MKTTNWDAVAAAVPNDATAGRVVGQGNVESGDEPPPRCPPIKPRSDVWDRQILATFDELVGGQYGRVRVIGLSYGKNRRGRSLWVVRCGCGTYMEMGAKTVRRFRDRNGCSECRTFAEARQKYDENGGRSVDEFAEWVREDGT